LGYLAFPSWATVFIAGFSNFEGFQERQSDDFATCSVEIEENGGL
jgi:hypothetical protein